MAFHRIAAVCALMLVASTPTARADANSLFELLGPREIGVGESMRGEAKGALAITLNPAGLPLTKELVFESGYGYRPDDDASVLSVSACDSTVPVPGCFYYRYFTAEPELGGESFKRRAHEAGYVAARSIGENFVLGFTYKYFDYNSQLTGENEGDASGHGIDFGLSFIASPSLKLGFVGYNVTKTSDSANYPRAFGGGIMLRPAEPLTLSADVLFNTELEEDQSSGRFGGGVEYFVLSSTKQAGYPLRLGVVHDNTFDGTYITGGAGYRTGRVGLDVGMRRQVAGDGDELMVVGSIRLFGPKR